jgi:hypothetical protein
MICDRATTDCLTEGCGRAHPHECERAHPIEARRILCRKNFYVRCIPCHKHRSYDAEGRAARLKCIRFLRVTRPMTVHEYQREAMRVLAKGILQAMRDARKGAK